MLLIGRWESTPPPALVMFQAVNSLTIRLMADLSHTRPSDDFYFARLNTLTRLRLGLNLSVKSLACFWVHPAFHPPPRGFGTAKNMAEVF